ncbi:phenylalanine--tRNA ligase subunit beta [Microbotryomycetes sp. JL221]|nr:phenylalanine--tRNA ligase subunit beta [Microbotryomycetes sp. JL221]
MSAQAAATRLSDLVVPDDKPKQPLVPSTLLPNDPNVLKRFIRLHHLDTLRQLYELKTLSHARQRDKDQPEQQQDHASNEERLAHEQGDAGHASRQNSSSSQSQSHDVDLEQRREDAELRKKLGLDKPGPQGIDRLGHAYEFVYDLAPGASADEYYHGPHPAPPACVVKAVLSAAKHPPLFDPDGLSPEQLEAAAQQIWQEQGVVTDNAEQDEAWEQQMIAAFSASCAEKLGRSLMELPAVDRIPLAAVVPPTAPPLLPTQAAVQPPAAAVNSYPTNAAPPPPPQLQPGQLPGANPNAAMPPPPPDMYAAPYSAVPYWKYLPTITVDRDNFFEKLGKHYTTNEFDELLFEYGLELDEDTTTDPAHPKGEPHQLKIEVPANRYDLLCGEGLVRALKLYLHPEIGAAQYKLVPAPQGQERTVIVRPEASHLTIVSYSSFLADLRHVIQTAQIRPYFASAILRNVTFDHLSYASFIDLQDKLHSNLARKRTLVAIGTHDLDKIAPGDISYEALPPKDIKFVPLNKGQAYTAEELMVLYKEDKHLGRYLHIIEDSPVYPIIYDTTRQVLSMPPIINSEGTKISVDTKNVFIDVTATDETKLQYVVDMIVTMFSEYCAEPFTVEPVKLVFEEGCKGGARTVMSPRLAPRPFTARASYINSCTGLSLNRDQVVDLLKKMGHDAYIPTPEQQKSFVAINAQESLKIGDDDIVHVLVPPTRPDILHECDIMEDAAVAYGFNNLKRVFPSTNTVAKPFPPNKLSDILRRLCAEAGWTEVLPLILCSHDENFKFLNRKDPGDLAVVLANPKTVEYQIVRTSLLPGILKSIRENRKHALPLKVFEVSDVVVKDASMERQARNIRRLAAVFCGRRAGFEIVHGLLDRLMLGLGVKNLGNESSSGVSGYYIKACDDDTFFPNRAAKIYYRPGKGVDAPAQLAPVASATPADASVAQQGEEASTQEKESTGPLDTMKQKLASVLPGHKTAQTASKSSPALVRDIEIGSLGILHPTVLKSFELDYPCSALEFDVEPFL